MRNKIVFVICGALLVGGVSGTVVALSAMHHTPTATASGSGTTQASTISPTATVTAGATATDTASSNPPNNPDPTAVPTSTPRIFATPCPFPTPPPLSGTVQDLTGTIASVNRCAYTFVLTTPKGSFTCVVYSNTQWSGTAQGINDLSIGAPAEVHGVPQPNGTIIASTEVNAQDR